MWLATFGDQIEYTSLCSSIHIFFEVVFVLGMLVKLLTDYHMPGETEPIRDLELIARKYIYSWVFVLDLTSVIPFSQLLPVSHSELFYIIKIYRMIFVLKYFSLGIIFKAIKDRMLLKNLEKVRRDPVYAEDTFNDNNQIELLKYIYYFIKIFRLITIILNICFFIGMSRVILCKIEFRYQHEKESENFMSSFGLEKYSPIDLSILSTYFMFTTLS